MQWDIKQPSWSGPILVAVDADGADALGVRLADLRRVARRVQPVAVRTSDGAKLRRVVELLSVLDPQRAEFVRISCLAPGKASEARRRRAAAAG
jgi:hypothetical protein